MNVIAEKDVQGEIAPQLVTNAQNKSAASRGCIHHRALSALPRIAGSGLGGRPLLDDPV